MEHRPRAKGPACRASRAWICPAWVMRRAATRLQDGLLRCLGHQHPEEEVDELPRARHRKDDKDHPDQGHADAEARGQPGADTGDDLALPATSITLEPDRSDMARCAGGGDHPILGRDQVPARLGPPGGVGDGSANQSRPRGTCESARNAACWADRSAANEAWNFSRSKSSKPSLGGRIGDTGAPGGGSAIRVLTDSPLSGANAAMSLPGRRRWRPRPPAAWQHAPWDQPGPHRHRPRGADGGFGADARSPWPPRGRRGGLRAGRCRRRPAPSWHQACGQGFRFAAAMGYGRSYDADGPSAVHGHGLGGLDRHAPAALPSEPVRGGRHRPDAAAAAPPCRRAGWAGGRAPRPHRVPPVPPSSAW
jgi:hypothetical protein